MSATFLPAKAFFRLRSRCPADILATGRKIHIAEELGLIVRRSAHLLNCGIAKDGAVEIAKRSRGEARDTIEDVLESYLIQQGYLQRTPRRRVATASIWKHFGWCRHKRRANNSGSGP